MAFDRILIAVDGSSGGLSAARLGGEIARGRDAEIVLVHAVPLPPVVLGIDQAISDESIAYLERNAQQAIAEAAKVLADEGVAAEHVIKPGGAADVILDIAEERNIDLIVVGHRGLGAMRRFILGSVSSKLAHHARCAVLLAPVPEEA